MKVYIVMSGMDNYDSSPCLSRVFARRDDAAQMILEEFEKEYLREVELWSEEGSHVRKVKTDDRWSIEVYLSDIDDWFEFMMWTIIEQEVL